MTELHISERLRGETMPFRDLRTTRRNEVLYEAADRVEKLEAALRDCMEMAEVHEIPFRNRVMYISDVARKALEGKDD